jgi:hypothetical protein
MKKVTLVVALAFVIGLTFLTLDGNAQTGIMGGGMMGNGITGSGQMGRGMGSGMGNLGYGNLYGPPNGSQYQQPHKQLEEKDARTILRNYLNGARNPNLKLGRVQNKGNAFEGEILTKNDSLVDRILVDKDTGEMHSVY